MKMEAADLIELSLIPFRIKSVQPPGTSFCLMPLLPSMPYASELSELSFIQVRIKIVQPPGTSFCLMPLASLYALCLKVYSLLVQASALCL